MQAQRGDLAPEAAEYLLSIGFDEGDRRRMQQLAHRSESGILTVDEQAEFDIYLPVGNRLALMQSTARVVLR
ncbi:MAG TPA: hypothetical protein VNY05_01215 [Candidatus Acidoferrales bacterium]|jgi:hypothetical protein|nr:hypothetical protein [Candidatus Acidoferrales bacterium]